MYLQLSVMLQETGCGCRILFTECQAEVQNRQAKAESITGVSIRRSDRVVQAERKSDNQKTLNRVRKAENQSTEPKWLGNSSLGGLANASPGMTA